MRFDIYTFFEVWSISFDLVNYPCLAVRHNPAIRLHVGFYSIIGVVSEYCEPCPTNGVCYDGKLECGDGYRKHGNLCVEDGDISKAAKKLVYDTCIHIPIFVLLLTHTYSLFIEWNLILVVTDDIAVKMGRSLCMWSLCSILVQWKWKMLGLCTYFHTLSIFWDLFLQEITCKAL